MQGLKCFRGKEWWWRDWEGTRDAFGDGEVDQMWSGCQDLIKGRGSDGGVCEGKGGKSGIHARVAEVVGYTFNGDLGKVFESDLGHRRKGGHCCVVESAKVNQDNFLKS